MKKLIKIIIIIVSIGSLFSPLIQASIGEDSFESCSLIDEDIIFFDDFNDNQKDLDKWTEVYSDGQWEEKNGICDLLVYEPANNDNNNYEGLESREIDVFLNPITPLTLSVDFITDLGSSAWAGVLCFEISDGPNWIRIEYSRYRKTSRFWDSNDDSRTDLSYQEDGTFNVMMQIYSDRYEISFDGESTGIIYDSVLRSDVLKIRIYLRNSGTTPNLYQHSGFDNVVASFEQPNIKEVFLFGTISEFELIDGFISLETLSLKEVGFSPFYFNKYEIGETIFVEDEFRGSLSVNRVFGVFKVLY